MIRNKLKVVLLVVFCQFSIFGKSQSSISISELAGQLNVITSAVPFLTIAPDSRSGAMGDVGVATTPDAYSLHWNPAKLAFIGNNAGGTISYTPWLKKLVDDISLSYLSGYYRIDQKQAVSGAIRYFSMGNITFTDISGNPTQDFNPHEFSLDLAYALKLSENFSGGIAMRYIYSNLTGNEFVNNGTATHPGNTVAADISAYYQKPDIKVFQKPASLAFGMNISNIGAKISYTNEAEKSFIPTNLRIGGALTFNLDDYNAFTVATDLNKLLIPTPPQYVKDPNSTAPPVILGKNNNVSIITGIFQSFSDAPGGLVEELHEIMYSVGVEYWYAKQFALRGGYFHEHETKGNRKYFTFGLGLKLNVFGINFSYLLPVNQSNPLENTLRFSLIFDFETKKVSSVKKSTQL